MNKQMFTIFLVLISVKFAVAGSVKCIDLVPEFKAMRQAQKSVISSMVSDNEVYATTMESYSTALDRSSGQTYKITSSSLNKSAKSIRNRGLKMQKTAKKLDSATDDLIQRFAECL